MKFRHAITGIAIGLSCGAAVAAGPSTDASAKATASASTSKWRVVYHNASVHGLLDSAVALSRTNAWAVGVQFKGQSVNNQPFVQHWNGKSWSAVSIPGSNGIASSEIAASSATNVWVDGHAAPGASRLFRWDGAHWHSIPAPDGFSQMLVLGVTSVWGIGQGVCSSTTGRGTYRCTTGVWHWNGQKWQSYLIGTDASGISGTPRTGIWVTGISGLPVSGGPGYLAVYRLSGGKWTEVKTPHPRTTESPLIAVVSPSSIWVTSLATSSHYGLVLHWDGSAWKQAPLGHVPAGAGDTPDMHGGVWLGPWAHWTGKTWINPMPTQSGIRAVDDVVRVPGMTATYWGPGAVGGSLTASGNYPAMSVYGPLP